MNHDTFIGQVQHRAHLASRGAAETIVRATLETLRERLLPETAEHIAAQLPPEIARHLRGGRFEHLDLGDFLRRVADREGEDVIKSAFHVRCVMQTIYDAVSPGAGDKLLNQLPDDFKNLIAVRVRRESAHDVSVRDLEDSRPN